MVAIRNLALNVRKSIKLRLLAYSALYFALLLPLATFALIQITSVENVAQTLNRTSLPGTRMLADMASRLSAFQHAEAMQRFDMGMHGHDQAMELKHESRHALENLQAKFSSLSLSEGVRVRLQEFNTALAAYLTAHGEWAKRKAAHQAASSGIDGEQLNRLYTAASAALATLSTASTADWESRAASAEKAAEWTLGVLVGMAALGALLGGWLMLEIKRRVSDPVVSITRALSALAAGDTHVVVPEAHRADEIGEMAKVFEVFRRNVWDLEEAHEATREAHRLAESLARHDPLTGLPNRRVFSEELESAVAVAEEGTLAYGLLLLDLDRFKPVNDIYGHPTGDAVLCEVAARLRDVLRPADRVARLGGDEFGVIVELDAKSADLAESTIKLASRIIKVISQPILLGDTRVEVGATIGIANCPGDGGDAKTLLRVADIAMYRAKRDGRGTFHFFEQTMEVELKARAALEADLRRAVSNGEIQPHYQPIMAFADDRLLGFEVLARWHHPDKGILPPATFIPLAEETGLIRDLSFNLLRRACLDAKEWGSDLTISFNMSPLQLEDSLLPTRILAILSETDFAPRRLEIEITESALIADLKLAKSILGDLQNLGITIALDDFGTGYSSLYHLRELHFDKIKIDRSFVQSMRDNPESEKIVNAILGLAKSLGLPAIAEGIEDAEVLQQMIRSGCELGQGFYFGKAMPVGDADALVRDRATDVGAVQGAGRLRA